MSGATRYAAVVEAHFHLGELYFMLPFLSSIEYEPGERICLLFTSRRLHEQFLGDPLLVRAAASIDAEIIVVPARPERTASAGRVAAHLRRIRRRAVWPFRARAIRRVLDRTDLLITQIAQGYAEQAISGRRRPSIVRYPHTSAPQIMNVAEASKQTFRQAAPGEPILLLDPEAVPYYELYGFTKSVILGYHALTDSWLQLVEEHAGRPGGHAVVFSFAARPDILPLAEWTELHRSGYRSIRAVFGDIPIVVKPHPWQDVEALRSFIATDGWTGVELVTENPMLAAFGARLCVSFLTGGIYNAMMYDIPSVNYFNAHEAYTRGHGSVMQDFVAVGALDARTEEQLVRELERIRDGEAVMDFGTRKRLIPLVRSFREFRERLAG